MKGCVFMQLVSRKVEKLLEEMGFVYEEENRWCASFIFDATGNILSIVGFVADDKYGIPVFCFRSYDENDNLLSEFTFDQLMLAYEREMKPVPVKTDKKYKATFSATIEVPVDMHDISHSVFKGYIYEGYETEEEIAQRYANDKLMDHLLEFNCLVVDFQPEAIEEIK